MSERIELHMTPMDCIIALSEGNPGAISVLSGLMAQVSEIDPDAAFGMIQPLLSLDTLGIYGPRIWMLYKDVCGENPVRALGVLRAVQLGIISASELKHAIDHYGDGIDVLQVCDAVHERLPNFSEGYRESEVTA